MDDADDELDAQVCVFSDETIYGSSRCSGMKIYIYQTSNKKGCIPGLECNNVTNFDMPSI